VFCNKYRKTIKGHEEAVLLSMRHIQGFSVKIEPKPTWCQTLLNDIKYLSSEDRKISVMFSPHGKDG